MVTRVYIERGVAPLETASVTVREGGGYRRWQEIRIESQGPCVLRVTGEAAGLPLVMQRSEAHGERNVTPTAAGGGA